MFLDDEQILLFIVDLLRRVGLAGEGMGACQHVSVNFYDLYFNTYIIKVTQKTAWQGDAGHPSPSIQFYQRLIINKEERE